MKSETLFKIYGDIVLVESGEINLDEVDYIKSMIADECEVDFNEIEVVYIKGNDNISDFEVNSNGVLINYNDSLEINKIIFLGDTDDLLDIIINNGNINNKDELYRLN
jgi:hypothetical protein